MGAVVAVFIRGLIAVIGVTALVAVVWTGYVKRDALASTLAPASELVDRLRGVSSAADPATEAEMPAATGEPQPADQGASTPGDGAEPASPTPSN